MTLGFNSTLPCDSHRSTCSLTPHTPTCAPKFFSQKAQNAKPRAAFTCIFNQLPAAVSASRLFSHACELRSGYVSYFHILAKNDRGWGANILANSSERHEDRIVGGFYIRDSETGSHWQQIGG